MEVNYKQIALEAIKVRNVNELITSIIGVIVLAVLIYCTVHFNWWSWLQYIWGGLMMLTILGIPWTYFVSSPMFYKTFHYGMTDDFLYIKGGVWSISEVVVPMTKIQSIELTQGITMRKYGVFSVEMTTMQGSHVIPYIEENVAKQLRDDISKLARLKELDGV